MARYKDSVCRLCRREKVKLYLKGTRCSTEKCAFDRRGYAPGQHGQTRNKFSGYGQQLREKQKAKRIYGILEKQFRRYFEKANKKKGVTGETLLLYLESRIDNLVYRAGLANSRNMARQLITQGHFTVNGKKVSIPSFQVKVGSVISLKEKSKKLKVISENVEKIDERAFPKWLEFDKSNISVKVSTTPSREEINIPVTEQLIVELYSR